MMSSLSKQFRYYAFISYSRKNSKAAAYLHKQLEHFRIPVKYVAEENRPKGQKFLRPVFRDRRDLEAGEGNFTSHIKTAIGESRYLIVLCSQEAAASIWVNEEIKHFLATHNNDYKALEYYKKALDIARKRLGEQHSNTKFILKNIESVKEKLKK